MQHLGSGAKAAQPRNDDEMMPAPTVKVHQQIVWLGTINCICVSGWLVALMRGCFMKVGPKFRLIKEIGNQCVARYLYALNNLNRRLAKPPELLR